jgi:Clp amino terminal domain, pathogenicity island component
VFERFTEHARQVVVLAQEEARALGHNYIGTEHILLGLVREEAGLAAQVLQSLGISAERVRAHALRIVGPGEEATSGQIPFTPRAKKVLELSLREALSLGHNHIGTEHILLGLVRENDGVAARILLDFDADPERIRAEVRRRLSGPGRRTPAACRRPPNPLRPPLDWERAGILWRPDRVLRGGVREVERVATLALEQLGVRVSRVRSRQDPEPPRAAHAPTLHPPERPRPRPHGTPQSAPALGWAGATVLWRPEGLELRVPLRLEVGAMAALANDDAWGAPPLAGLRREIWNGWLALASPTLLEDVDPGELRRALDAAAARARNASNAESERVQGFLRRLRG